LGKKEWFKKGKINLGGPNKERRAFQINGKENFGPFPPQRKELKKVFPQMVRIIGLNKELTLPQHLKGGKGRPFKNSLPKN